MCIRDRCRELDEASVRDAGGKIKLKRSTRGFAARPNPNDPENGAPSMDVFDVRDVRPGRLVDCVINMRVAMTSRIERDVARTCEGVRVLGVVARA